MWYVRRPPACLHYKWLSQESPATSSRDGALETEVGLARSSPLASLRCTMPQLAQEKLAYPRNSLCRDPASPTHIGGADDTGLLAERGLPGDLFVRNQKSLHSSNKSATICWAKTHMRKSPSETMCFMTRCLRAFVVTFIPFELLGISPRSWSN